MDTDYQHFDARAYLKERCPGNEFQVNDKRIHTQWGLTVIHNFYKEFHDHSQWDNSSASLLKFSGGPYITYFI